MSILHHAAGGLKVIIHELEAEEFTSEDSGDAVYKHMCSSSVEYTEKKLPQAIEKGIND